MLRSMSVADNPNVSTTVFYVFPAPGTEAAPTASTIFLYPVHRHRLEDMDRTISSLLGCGILSNRPFAVSIMPGVQKPH